MFEDKLLDSFCVEDFRILIDLFGFLPASLNVTNASSDFWYIRGSCSRISFKS